MASQQKWTITIRLKSEMLEGETDRLREEESCQTWSGSIPAGSFCSATRKMFFSLYEVYRVRMPIMMKYVKTDELRNHETQHTV